MPAARRIATALAAFTLTAGIEAVFVPPAVATPTPGWEAQPPTIVKKSAVHGVQDSLALRSDAVPFGWWQQPSNPPRRGTARSLVQESVSLRSTTPLLGWHVQPFASTRIGQSRPNFEGWPLDVAAPAAPAPVWGWEHAAQRPIKSRWAIAGSAESAVFRQSITLGWDSGQPSRVASKSTVRTQQSGIEFDVAQAVVDGWWGETMPPLVRGAHGVIVTYESMPLDLLFVDPGVVVPPVTPPATGGMMTSGGGRFVRVDDGTIKRLPALDTTAYARTDRPILSQRIIVASAGSQCDQPVLVAYAAFTAQDAVGRAQTDQPALRKDDLAEIARLTKLARTPKPIPDDIKAPADVRGIWALIDRMRGKK